MPERRICAVCGHQTFLHRANGEWNAVKLDDPVPCFAAIEQIEHRPATERTVAVFRYRYCGCTAVWPLRAERSGR